MDISRFQEFLTSREEVIGEMENISEKERMSG
jgi:hypothetical protein